MLEIKGRVEAEPGLEKRLPSTFCTCRWGEWRGPGSALSIYHHGDCPVPPWALVNPLEAAMCYSKQDFL